MKKVPSSADLFTHFQSQVFDFLLGTSIEISNMDTVYKMKLRELSIFGTWKPHCIHVYSTSIHLFLSSFTFRSITFLIFLFVDV